MQTKTLLAAALAVAGVAAQNATMNLTSLLGSNQNLSALTNLLGAYPQFAAAVANRTNVTLFAPSNDAIQALNVSGALVAATQIPNFIQDLLSYHILNGTVYASAFSSTPAFLHTNLVDPMYSNVTGGQVVEARLVGTAAELISGDKAVANVTQANLNFTGGVVHVINQVLNPPPGVGQACQDANLTALLGLLSATNLTSTVANARDLTIFAPSNSAFQNIASAAGNLSVDQLTQIAEYHVLNGTVAYSSMLSNTTVKALSGGSINVTIEGGSVFVNSARVINADILFAGGVIHIIDSVLNPNATSAAPNATATGGVTAFPGASSGSAVPLTSGVPTPTTTNSQLVATNTAVASGYTAAAGAGGASASGSAKASSSSAAGAAPMQTGAMGVAALFGAGMAWMNL